MLRKILFYIIWIALIISIIILVGAAFGGLNFFYKIVS